VPCQSFVDQVGGFLGAARLGHRQPQARGVREGGCRFPRPYREGEPRCFQAALVAVGVADPDDVGRAEAVARIHCRGEAFGPYEQ